MNYTVDEISKVVGVSHPIIRQKLKDMNISTSDIDDEVKSKLIEACAETLNRKKSAKEFIEDVQAAEVGETEKISDQTGSTLEQRLSIAKKEFDHISKSLAECQVAINLKGTILMNGNNGTISSNPAVKTKCELLKQHNALQKTITELENALKLSALHKNVIDDE